MTYWTNIFTQKNWCEFLRNGSNRCGFPEERKELAKKVKIEDIFICYIRGESKFCGIVEIRSEFYIDGEPMYSDLDIYPVRFNVVPLVLRRPENAISAKASLVWKKLGPILGVPDNACPPHWCEKLKSRSNLQDITEYGEEISQIIREHPPEVLSAD